MNEYRKQQILNHIDQIDALTYQIENCIMRLQQDTFMRFEEKIKHQSSEKVMMYDPEYGESIRIYRENVEWLENLRAGWLNNL